VCGIAGWAGPDGGTQEVLRAMTDCLIHRGPDEDGYYFGPEAALGMRRLSIIDVKGGHQPVWSEDKKIVAIFNGEIYNFRELFDFLETKGHTLRSKSDSEVIPHLYEEFGPDFVTRLRGMFAIALFDSRSNTLFLARDRAGKKPLYYACIGKNLFFGSEAKALLANPRVPREPNLSAIDVFLAYAYVPHPMSAFAGINKLPPAHYLTFNQNQITLTRYWQLDYTPKAISEKQTLAELPDLLQEAVNIRMISERPLGAFLSGGVDSSLVTALMTKVSTQQVKTYSIGFDDPRYDERQWSRKVARHLDTDHTELVVKPDVVDVVHKLTDYFDEPFADSSAIPSYYVAKMAREHVVVVLNGDGGDESFGGYPRYALATAFQQFSGLHSLLRLGRPFIGLAAKALNQRRLKRLNEVLVNAPKSLVDSYRFPMTYATLAERESLWQERLKNQIDIPFPITLFENWWAVNPTVLGAQTMLSVDVESYLPGDLLPKVDITTMSQSLEARSPLLDQKVMEYAAHLPYDLKVKGMQTKIILKQVARKFLPNEVIDRPKMGFGIPRAEWLRGPLQELVNDSLLAPDAVTGSWFDRNMVQSIVRGHMAGTDKDLLLWPLLTLELWGRRWLRA